ncbi:MAG: septum formation initiator family protein [Patescibacteria group bacterium]
MQKSSKFKSKSRRKFYWPLIVFSLLVLAVSLIIGNIQLARQRGALNHNLLDLQSQLERASRIVNQPRPESSPAYLEKMAREQLNLMKPGESVAAFPEKLSEEYDKTEGLLQKIKDKIK